MEWEHDGVKFRYIYKKHKGKTYRRKQRKTRKGKWVFVGIVFIMIAAAVWAPAGGFSWLFRTTMA